LHAQLGILRYSLGDEDQALDHLAKASARVAEAQLFRASLLFRQGNFDEAKKVLDLTSRFNKKHVLLHNVYAYMLEKKGQRTEAIAQLNRLLKQEQLNEATKDNLLRLQNDKKMNMKRFGMTWYALQLEKPPASMGQRRPPRAGFRQKKRKKQ
jgi:tetratricopeptide (TPR) repeat protein